ncbi:hypothetical protein QCB44_00640 [Thiomicrorhabdus sp. zzn3]|uniref:hypothetical protein n=1 Tax=Thiomicrorhabdus sp. zzn3 TaxID=3039775 RepID=UPI002436EA1D|nr:hypothetical protein [Thiomicrorhabdus sp. zzn3]MDG6777203.1 hypothetical protein [Thiomicrorhabdus sp. zzn3]
MSMKIEEHATAVVKRFKEMLSDEQVALIGDEHFEELEVLIEAAIGSSEAKALSEAVKQVEDLAKSLANHVATIKNLEM